MTLILLVDEDNEPIALIQRIEKAEIERCIREVDKAFREWCDLKYGVGDTGVIDESPWLCEKVGVRYRRSMNGWTDVLVGLIEKNGGASVFYQQVCAVPSCPSSDTETA